MKRANGSGSIVNYGKGRRPYAARVTVGWDGDKQQIRNIGFFATRQEAEAALVDYIRSPYDVDARKITMAELYERWYKRAEDTNKFARNTMIAIKSAYKRCSDVHSMPYTSIRAHMMQDIIATCRGTGTGNYVKVLFHHLDNYALELDIVDKTYSHLIQVPSYAPKKQKTIFSDAEVGRLWDNADKPWVDTVLILLYSGWRVSELLSLRTEDINLAEMWMRGGIKTKAGKNRIVPIHSSILPFVDARVRAGNEHIITTVRGGKMSYHRYFEYFAAVMQIIGASHTIHETRHTFRTWLDMSGANYACVNKIMGHTCSDIGLQVYTHKTIGELRKAIEMIEIKQINNLRLVSNA